MPYIDFNTPPVKELSIISPTQYDCENCIHRVFIPGGVYRCSITNKYMYKNYIYNTICNNKNTVIEERKVITGLFTFDKNGNSKWIGMLSIADIKNLDDTGIFKMLVNDFEKEVNKKFPYLKDTILVNCIIAESRNGNPFVKITNLLEDDVVKEIIDDANIKFLNQ